MFYRRNDSSAMNRVSYHHVDAVESAERVENYLRDKNSECYDIFASYMKHKAVFSVAHTFSKMAQKEFFKRLIKEYDVRKSMKLLTKNSKVDKKTRLAAGVYLVSPWMFYYTVGRM